MLRHPGIQLVEAVFAQGLFEFHCRLLWNGPSLIVQLLEIRGSWHLGKLLFRVLRAISPYGELLLLLFCIEPGSH